MNSNKLPMIAAGAMIAVAALITFALQDFRAELWIPSLVCNLATTALALLIVNVFGERLLKEARQRPIAIVPQLAASTLVMIAGNTLNGFTAGAKEGLEAIRLVAHQFRDAEEWMTSNMDRYQAFLDPATTRSMDTGLRALLALRDLKLSSDSHRTLEEAYRALRDMIATADWIARTYPVKGDEGSSLDYAKKWLEEFETRHGIKCQGRGPEDSRMGAKSSSHSPTDDSWRVQI